MSFIDAAKINAQQRQRRRTTESFVETPTFTEAMSLAYDETAELELLNSRVHNEKKYWNPQKERIWEMYKAGEVTQEEMDRFRTPRRRRGNRTEKVLDYNLLGDYLNETYGTDFDFSVETLNARIIEASEERQKQMAKNGIAGTAGSFAGTFGAYANPAQSYANTLVLGVTGVAGGISGVVGKSVASTAAKIAFREALIGLGEESINQAHVYGFKKRIGTEYKASDAAMNLLAAMVFSGTIGGATGAVRSMRFQQALNEATLNDTITSLNMIIDELEARNTGAVWYHGTETDIEGDFQPNTFFTSDPSEASSYANLRTRDQARIDKLRAKHELADYDGPERLSYVGIREDIPKDRRGEWWATDDGVVTFRDGKWRWARTVDTGDQFDPAAMTINVVEGDGAARMQESLDLMGAGESVPAAERTSPTVLPVLLPESDKFVEVSPYEANLLGQRLTENMSAALKEKRDKLLAKVEQWKREGYVGIRTTSDDPGFLMEGKSAPEQRILFDGANAKSAFENRLDMAEQQALADAKAQVEFLKSLPPETSAKQALDDFAANFDKPVEPVVPPEVREIVEATTSAKATAVIDPDNPQNVNLNTPGDNRVLELDDNGQLVDRGSLDEVIAKADEDLNAALADVDAFEACLRG